MGQVGIHPNKHHNNLFYKEGTSKSRHRGKLSMDMKGTERAFSSGMQYALHKTKWCTMRSLNLLLLCIGLKPV